MGVGAEPAGQARWTHSLNRQQPESRRAGEANGPENSGVQCLAGRFGLASALCLQCSPALVSPAPRPAPARRLAADAQPPVRALRRRVGLVVPSSTGRGRGRALRPPLRPHYGGAQAAHRDLGARWGSPRLPPPHSPSPPPSQQRRAGRRLPPASLSAAVRAGPARVGAGSHHG